MSGFVKKIYREVKRRGAKLGFYYSVNWTKTLYFNFKKFPIGVALKLPVFFYNKVRFASIEGTIIIDAPIKRGMIGFGQPYELISRSKGPAEVYLKGKVVFKGHVQFGKDYFIYVDTGAYCEFGHMSSLGRDGKVICKDNIILGDYARIGYESQIIDTSFHQMNNTMTGEKYPMTSAIVIGNYNYIGNRVSIMQKTKTPAYFTIASNSLCNSDYRNLGENTMVGGIPCKLLRSNISRDWIGEQENLNKYLII